MKLLISLLIFASIMLFLLPSKAHASSYPQKYVGTISGIYDDDTVTITARCYYNSFGSYEVLDTTTRTGPGSYTLSPDRILLNCLEVKIYITGLDSSCTATPNPIDAPLYSYATSPSRNNFSVSCPPTPTAPPVGVPTPTTSMCTFRLNGTIIDEDTNVGLNGANALITKSGSTIGNPTTNSSGNFTKSWTAACVSGVYTVTGSKAGCTTSGITVAMGGIYGYTKNVTIGLNCGSSPPTPTSGGTCNFKITDHVYQESVGTNLQGASVTVRKAGTSTIVSSGTTNTSGIYVAQWPQSCADGVFTVTASKSGCEGENATVTLSSSNNYTVSLSQGLACIPPPTYTVNVRAFNDTNGDKIKQAGESYYTNTISANIVYAGNNYGIYSGSGLISLNFTGTGTANVTLQPVSGYTISSNNPQSKTTTDTNKVQDLEFGIVSDIVASTPTLTPTPTQAVTATPTPPSAEEEVVKGTVYKDIDNNMCTTIHPQEGVQMRLYNTTTSALEDTTVSNTGTGAYSLGALNPSGTYSITLANTYTVKGVRDESRGDSGFDSEYYNGYAITYPRNINDAVDFCLSVDAPPGSSSALGWFQTSIGSVRMGQINNPVPLGKLPSTNDSHASVFYSTLTSGLFGDAIGATKWRADNESVVNTPFPQGHASYTFYKSQAETNGIQLDTLPDCDLSNNCSINNPPANKVYFVNGNMAIINGTNKISGSRNRVVILVNGNVTIRGNITVDSSNLFILAAKGTITIEPQVGELDPASTDSNLAGVYTAEGSIIIDGTEGDSCPTSDRRLNVSGSLIANAASPFTTGGAGKVAVNHRSLCDDNDTYPVLTVTPRFDFVTALTGFYKVSTKSWNEVEP